MLSAVGLSRRILISRRLAATAVVLALCAAACGGDKTTATGQPPVGETTVTAAESAACPDPLADYLVVVLETGLSTLEATDLLSGATNLEELAAFAAATNLQEIAQVQRDLASSIEQQVAKLEGVIRPPEAEDHYRKWLEVQRLTAALFTEMAEATEAGEIAQFDALQSDQLAAALEEGVELERLIEIALSRRADRPLNEYLQEEARLNRDLMEEMQGIIGELQLLGTVEEADVGQAFDVLEGMIATFEDLTERLGSLSPPPEADTYHRRSVELMRAIVEPLPVFLNVAQEGDPQAIDDAFLDFSLGLAEPLLAIPELGSLHTELLIKALGASC